MIVLKSMLTYFRAESLSEDSARTKPLPVPNN